MNITQGIPLNDFMLDERTYERSRFWSGFLKQTANRETYDEVSLHDLSSVIQDESDKDKDGSCSDDSSGGSDKIVDLLHKDKMDKENLSNRSVVHLRTLSNLIMDEEDGETGDDVNMQDLLDQTLPILAERDRKWKESGMLRVLNTFDEKKIEEKVGNWLRNNSTIVTGLPASATCQPSGTLHYVHAHPIADSEEESMHSIDTARYVLSNRKPRTNSGNCTTTTIKAFRLLQSKRDALREKYAFPEDKELRQTLKTNNIYSRYIPSVRSSHVLRHSVSEFVLPKQSACLRRKRKLFNKRRARTCSSHKCCSSSSTSSDDDHEAATTEQNFYLANGVRQQWRRQQMSPCCKLQSSKSKRIVSSSSILLSAEQKTYDCRPRMRESECCCNSNRLCKKTQHLADTSTEEWVVENLVTKKKSLEVKAAKLEKPKSVGKPKKEKKNIVCKQSKQVHANKSSANTKKEQSNDSDRVDDNFDDTFEREELKLAIELSKKTHETELMKLNENDGKVENKEVKIKKIKTQTESELKNSNKSSKINFDVQPVKNKEEHIPIKQNFKESIDDVPKNEKKNCLKRQSHVVDKIEHQDSHYSIESSPEITLRPQPRSAKQKKLQRLKNGLLCSLAKTASQEEASFLSSPNIYNSTAITNIGEAGSKQLSSASALSIGRTTKKCSILPIIKTTKTAATYEADCSIVSSTTGNSMHKASTTINTNNNGKGILLYTPQNRTQVPVHSFSDGIFNITEEHLSTVIGEKSARKFLKYYMGRRRFDANLTVYFMPPRNNSSHIDEDEDTDSDDDPITQIGRYGQLYASFEKNN